MRFLFSSNKTSKVPPTGSSNSNEFWLIAAPAEPTPIEAWRRVMSVTSGLAHTTRCNVPDLKVGTLDQLIALSDDLAKLDTDAEQAARKLVQYFASVLEGGTNKLHENLTIGNKDARSYLLGFQWESSKYPLKQPLKVLYELIAKQITLIEMELRAKSNAYDNVKSAVKTVERRAAGPLLTRDLSDVVPQTARIVSEHLTTVAVVVPKHSTKEWEATYTTFADMVVPKSAVRIVDDADFALYIVILFRKCIEEYQTNCRMKKFIVRELEANGTNNGGVPNGKAERDQLVQERQRQYGPLIRWLRVNFGEIFSAYLHIKVMRTFVESVLRFGLPVNFLALLVEPVKSSQKKTRVALAKLFRDLDSGAFTPAADEFEKKTMLAGLGVEDYYPYVSFNVIIDFEKKS